MDACGTTRGSGSDSSAQLLQPFGSPLRTDGSHTAKPLSCFHLLGLKGSLKHSKYSCNINFVYKKLLSRPQEGFAVPAKKEMVCVARHSHVGRTDPKSPTKTCCHC